MRVFIANNTPQPDEKHEELLLELKEFEVVGQSQDVESALNSIRDLKPDVVLLDIAHLGDDGRSLLSTITTDKESPVLMMRADSVAGLYPKQPAGSSDFLLHATADRGKALAIIEGLLLHLNSKQRCSKRD